LEGDQVLTTGASLWATLDKQQTNRFLKENFNKSSPAGKGLENFDTQAEERLETIQIDSKSPNSKNRPKEKRRKRRRK